MYLIHHFVVPLPQGEGFKKHGKAYPPVRGLFYSAVFLLLEGYADGVCAGLGVVRSDCDLIGGTVCVAGVIHAVLDVALDTLVVLTAILIIH